MFESWPHHVKWYIRACLVSANHPKHGQKSSSRMTWASWAALGSRIKVALDLVRPILHFAFLSEILGSEKSSLVCHLWRAYHATSLCLVCLSDVRCTSSAAIAPGQMDMFFGDQTEINIPRKCMLFSACSFFKCLSLCCALNDGNKDWRSPQECAGEG